MVMLRCFQDLLGLGRLFDADLAMMSSRLLGFARQQRVPRLSVFAARCESLPVLLYISYDVLSTSLALLESLQA